MSKNGKLMAPILPSRASQWRGRCRTGGEPPSARRGRARSPTGEDGGVRRGLRALAAAVGVTGLLLAAPVPAYADTVRGLEYWLDDYGIREAWATTQGAGVKVAVIDSGVAEVPELAGAVVGGTDVSGTGAPDGRTPVGSGQEHGTLVGTILAGRGTRPGAGMIGVAPQAELLSVSVGFGSGLQVEDQIAQA